VDKVAVREPAEDKVNFIRVILILELREAGVAPILTANTQDKVIPVKDKEDLNRVAPVV